MLILYVNGPILIETQSRQSLLRADSRTRFLAVTHPVSEGPARPASVRLRRRAGGS